MNTYSLLGIKVDSTAFAVRNQNVTSGIQALVQGASGAVDPTFAAIMQADPRIEFEIVDIAAALGVIGISGDKPTTFLAAFEQNTVGGLRSGTHRTVIPTACLIVPRTLTAVHNQEATLTYEAFCYGTTSNPPITVNSSGQTIAQTVSEKFTLGLCGLGNTDFEAQSLTINFGIDVAVHGNSGYPWPLHVAIRGRRPTIQITTLDVDKLGTVYPGSGALGLTVTEGEFILQKIAAGGGTRVAAATLEHILFTVTEAVAHFTTLGGGHGEEPVMGITIEPAYDGSNAIIQVDTTAAMNLTPA